MTEQELQSYLHREIPASKVLEVGVTHCSKEKIILSAPLAPNINHKDTAFGGSLSVIAILSGWSLLFMQLLGTRNEIVIQESHLSYLKPANGDFQAECHYQASPQWERFQKLYNKKGKARIELESDVLCNGEVVAHFKGNFVAFNKESNT